MPFLVLLSALAMPVVAWLSQRGVLGPTPGEISDRYPTLLVAAGYAFSIWGLIFLLDIVFALSQARPARLQVTALRRARPALAAAFSLTAGWQIVFAQQRFALALAMMFLLLACLVYAVWLLSAPESEGVGWLPRWAIGLHAGWVSLAAFLNLAQVIVAYGWLDASAMLPWSLALWAVATLTLLGVNRALRGSVPYVAAAVWGLAGAFVAQRSSSLEGSGVSAWTAAAIAGLLVAQTLWWRRSAPRVARRPGPDPGKRRG